MNNYISLIFICVIAIVILVMNIVNVIKLKDEKLKYLLMGLFCFSILRYLTLIVYGDTPTLFHLEILRYFYFATSMGLTVPTMIAVWYITPHFRNSIPYWKFILFFSPWILFYLFVIITQPTEIVMGQTFGYNLILVPPFQQYLAIVQGTFVIIILLLCTFGILQYKHPILRSQYVALILAQILLAIDGFLIMKTGATSLIPPFTVTEALGFLAVYYSFLYKPLDIKKGQ